jgi:tetratricopeptide (TPR) repeat protein
MQNLDLIVTADTSIAHLAGALGVPVWVALALAPDWRWLLHREESTWYPTMRLFRQTEPGKWKPVFERIAAEVRKLLAKATGGKPIIVGATQEGNERDQVESHFQQGVALAQQRKFEEAAVVYQQGLRLMPEAAEGHNNLGVVLAQAGRHTEAAASFREALRLQPHNAEAHNNLGNALREQGQPEAAVSSLREALRLRPDYASAHYNLGNALIECGRPMEALIHFQQAIHLKPGQAAAHSSLAVALTRLGRLEEAVASLQQAIRLKPDYAEAHFNLAAAWLLKGNLEQCWPEYEWRFQSKQVYLPPLPQPLWDGSPLAGRTILLRAEQGLGDTLHFIRYAPLVKKHGGNVLVECPKALLPLLTSCPGIDRLLPQSSPPAESFDIQAPLLSLPGLLRTTLATVPAKVPYLFAEPRLVEHWRQELRFYEGFKIGIAWQASPKYDKLGPDGRRSIPLVQFAPLGRLTDLSLLSLQRGHGTEQLPEATRLFPVADLGSWIDEGCGAFMGTAAVMRCLDLVITCDTSIAHLAGALGVPVWVALPFAPDGRWMLHRDDSPWYPTMRLFRQTEPGNWKLVCERIAGEVTKLLAKTTACSPVTVEAAPVGNERHQAEFHFKQGAALAEQGKFEEAAAQYQQAVRLKPDYVEAYNNLGIAFDAQGKVEAAVASYQQALRLRPDYVRAHNNLGITWDKQGKLDEAVASFRQALRLKPDLVEAYNNLGRALHAQGKVEEAIASCQQALRLKPDYAEAHGNLALAWLLMGNFEQGWQEYEWRFQSKQMSLPPLPQLRWDGSPLPGRTILLRIEQAIGDTLHFIRYAALVKERVGTVLVECPEPLIPLLSSCRGIDRLVSRYLEAMEPFDVHAPLLSLPGLFGTTLATVPGNVPYLFADAKQVEQWQQELQGFTGFKIGIAWQGNVKHERGRAVGQRSIPLAEFVPLGRRPSVSLFSLQRGAGTEQLPQVASLFPVTDLGSWIDEGCGAFMATAAVMKCLDLVITCDTAIAHLAGALGVPVWVALPFAAEWRWLREREDSPWYPTMRLFRQTEPGNWKPVFERIAGEVSKVLA